MKTLIKSVVCATILFVADLIGTITTNFAEINVADFISQNIKDCKKSNVGRVDFYFELQNGMENWYYYNPIAASDLAELTNNSCLFFEVETEDKWFAYGQSIDNDVLQYGLCDSNIESFSFEIELLDGKVNLENYYPLNVEPNSEEYHCVISERFADLLIEKELFETYHEIIGKQLTNKMANGEMIIDAICSNRSILNNYNNEPFIVSSFRSYKTSAKESLVYKALDEQYTNFSFFKTMFYNRSWEQPSGSNPEAKMLLKVPGNDWLVDEVDQIIEKSGKVNFYKYLLIFGYAAFGFFSYKIVDRNNILKDNFSRASFSYVLYFALFFLSSAICEHMFLFGRHLIGKSLDILIMEMMGLIFCVFGNLIRRLFFTKNNFVEDKVDITFNEIRL